MLFRDGDKYNDAEAGYYWVMLNKDERREIEGIIMNVSYERIDDKYRVFIFAGHEQNTENLCEVDSTKITCKIADIKGVLKEYISNSLDKWQDKINEIIAEVLRPKSYVDETGVFYNLDIAYKGKFALVIFEKRAEIYELNQTGYNRKHVIEGSCNVGDVIKIIEENEIFVETVKNTN